MSGTPVNLRGDDLLWVQRRYLDLLAERDALRQELTEAQMATAVERAERNVLQHLLETAKFAGMDDYWLTTPAGEAWCASVNAILGGGHADR